MHYLDTSAAIKFLIEESETKALRNFVAAKKATFVAAQIIDVELVRTLMRNDHSLVGKGLGFLDHVIKIEVTSDLIREAISISPDLPLRALDAIHVAAAHRLRRSIDGLVTYDVEMAHAAREMGIAVFSPGTTI